MKTKANKKMVENSLHQAFLNELADMASAEQQLVKALPKMIEAAESNQLRTVLEGHLLETVEHGTRIQKIAASLDVALEENTCEAMKGLIAEAKEASKEFKGSLALDAVLIACAQKVEHYEIASYGTLAAWARQMGHTDAVELLEESLSEEKAANSALTEVAQSGANRLAEVVEAR